MITEVEQPRDMETICMNENALSNISDSETMEGLTDGPIDCSDIPPLTEAFFKNASLWIPPSQVARWLKIDLEVLEWFQANSGDPKRSMNEVLREYVAGRSV
jgi:uncharacterized protein (DUF4415 family)